MKLIITKVTAFFDRVIDVLAVLSGVFLIYIMLSVSADVTARNLLNRPLPYTIDISEILLLFITFLVVAWVLKEEGHVRMDFLLDRFKPEHQSLINIITSILGAIICLVITWYGTVVTLDFFQRDVTTVTMLVLPRAPLLAVIPLGFFLLFIQLLRKSYSYLGEWRALRHFGEVEVITEQKPKVTTRDYA